MPRGRHIAVLVTALLVTGCTLHAAGPLTGPWRFAAGDRPEYASPTFDDSAWQQVRVPHRFETTLGLNYTGIAPGTASAYPCPPLRRRWPSMALARQQRSTWMAA